MKSTLQCIVISLLCSGSVFCELELYPDFQGSENPRRQWTEEDIRENVKQTPYENSARTLMYPPEYVLPLPISWPNVPARPTNPFHLKNVNYSPRLLEIAEQLYMKPKYDHANANKIINNVYEQLTRNAFPPFFKPNLRILDDVRQNSDSGDTSRLDLKNNLADETAEEYENSGREEEEEEPPREREAPWRNLDDPSEFAYLPSDPRYYQNDKHISALKLSKEISTDILTQDLDPVSISPRNEMFQDSTRSGMDFQKYLIGHEVKMIPVDSQHVNNPTGMYLVAVVAGISAAATVGLIAFAIGWYNLQKHVKNASDVEYPAYGVTGPNKEISPSTGDRRLAQSAQMYHYQHQKQQIIAMERAAATDRHGSISEADSEEENEEGDYTVYECPGLAPTGEMEVKNPLFQDDPTPAQTPALRKEDEK